MGERRIGIAVDFSAGSRIALQWAIDNVVRKGDHLILVTIRPEGNYEQTEVQLWEATGSQMSLLGFVKRKGKGYKATSRPLAPTEDFVLDRTAAVTYSIPETEKDDESRQPRGQTADNLGNLDRFLFSSDVPDKEAVEDSQGKGSGSVDHDTVKATPSPVRSGGSKEGSADKVVLGVEATGVSPSPARKEHHRKRKISEDIVDETPQSGKKHRQASDDEGSKGSEYSYDITETYVPRWNVKNGDTLVDPAVCYQILHHAIPPGELDRAREKKEDYPAEGASVSIVRALSSVSELVQSYCKKSAVEKRLRGRIEEYRAEITKLDAKLAKRKKGDRSSIKKGKQAIRAMEEMKEKHAQETKLFQQDLSSKDKEIEELKERNRLLDEQNISLTKASSSLQERIDKAAEEKEAWRQCKVNYDEALAAGDKVIDQLKVFLEDAEKDRDRLATEVIPLVVSKLHKSTEFLEPLGEMETLLYNSAFHDGIVAGFEGCSAGLKIEEIEGYDVKANTVYETGVKTWESTTYPFIEGMKGLKGKTATDVEKLVPSGSLVKDVS
ncbi:hypothetical protein M8C21_000358 [Ambrosia artemisiifolia]|uniref:UspA domain-containing protein n=1 Tax=Ambrosia artemisiifolia TaxID=4212 RepID=A0AAD5CUN9_AMBAR|nr:hypothetical protein M8C21_000358 [Ambrosia artemisiifolia]